MASSVQKLDTFKRFFDAEIEAQLLRMQAHLNGWTAEQMAAKAAARDLARTECAQHGHIPGPVTYNSNHGRCITCEGTGLYWEDGLTWQDCYDCDGTGRQATTYGRRCTRCGSVVNQSRRPA